VGGVKLVTEPTTVPVDNNAAERVLSVVTLGGKDALFACTNQSAANLLGLYLVISICEACGVNPIADLADLLFRRTSHPSI